MAEHTIQAAVMGTFALTTKLMDRLVDQGILTEDERTQTVVDAINALRNGGEEDAVQFIHSFYPLKE